MKRITPDKIETLKDNEIFVFGSNEKGFHGGGAALCAYLNFGAKWGVGEGLTGQSYALPTMEGEKSLAKSVNNFIECAKQHPDLTFLVTPVGCGIAGYSPSEVAPLFYKAKNIENICLPQSFWNILNNE